MKTVNTGYMIRAPCLGRMAAGSRRPLQLNIGRAALQIRAAQHKPPNITGGFFHTQNQQSNFLEPQKRQKVRKIYGIF